MKDTFNSDETIANDIEMFHEAYLQVIDMSGRIVLTRRNGEGLDGLHPGIYILRWITDNQVKTQKILVK